MFEYQLTIQSAKNPGRPIQGSCRMGKAGRDWKQVYEIYGVENWWSVVALFVQAAIFAALSVFLLAFFEPLSVSLHSRFPAIPAPILRLAAGVMGSVAGLTAGFLFADAAHSLHTSAALRWAMAQRVVAMVSDWSTVRTALDLGCGRGILLNAVALQLKKEGSAGCVVGLALRGNTVAATLRAAVTEGVQEYVTCRQGDPRRLPFAGNYFDVVVSGRFMHTVVGVEERGRVLGEAVRVMREGGVGVVWDDDRVLVAEYAERLTGMGMEEVRVAEGMVVAFRKPLGGGATQRVGVVVAPKEYDYLSVSTG
ncbi:hypothetical protein AMTRI_Chr02g219120 [Amborella trichopoda]